MAKTSKSFLEEFPLTIVLAIGGALLFNKVFGGFWITLLGLFIGGVLGLLVDSKNNSK